jgi:phage terminase large subunit-like protein
METAEADGYHLDHNAGMQIINFFPTALKHTKGRVAGKPFVLAPFQQFTMYNLFGWKDAEGKRRINTVYDKRAKKNGKTAEMAGMALGVMTLDHESSAEVYVGATKEDQAKLCWDQAADFIEHAAHASPFLAGLGFRKLQKEIRFTPLGSKMRPLGGDSKTQDGINSHLSIIDEYHAHKDDSVKENLESSSVQRLQPITYHITTAGVYTMGVCKHYEDTCIEILDGKKHDDHLWIMIHDLDPKDDWQDKANWFKANPLLGQGLSIESIEKEYTKATNQISKVPNFQTKHLNMWVDAPEVWILGDTWDKGIVKEIPEGVFKKLGSFAAADLSTTTDITAYVNLTEPDEDGYRYLKMWAFCPKETIKRRSREDKVPYDLWAREGWLIPTEGNVVDYEVVKNRIAKTYHINGVNRIEFDQWNAAQMVNELMEQGFQVSYFSQAISNMSAPSKEFEKLVTEGKILHEDNPLLKWMLSGTIVVRDANDNIKPHKGKSIAHGYRIDGIIATIMALGGSISVEQKKNWGKYSRPGAEIYI